MATDCGDIVSSVRLHTTCLLTLHVLSQVFQRESLRNSCAETSETLMPTAQRRTRHDISPWISPIPPMSRVGPAIARTERMTIRRPLSETLMPAAQRKVACGNVVTNIASNCTLVLSHGFHAAAFGEFAAEVMPRDTGQRCALRDVISSECSHTHLVYCR